MKLRLRSNLWKMATLSLGVLGAALLVSCQRHGEQQTAPSSDVAHSTIGVKLAPDKIIVRTNAAEFQLSPTGNLTASLISANSPTTLDSSTHASSQIIISGKSAYPGVQLELAQAGVTPTTGKLGPIGKKVVVTGNVPGTQLAETVTLEVYDSFPNLALLSISVRNTGKNDLQLDSVSLQHHLFEAPSSGESAKQPLWTFQGSSLKWGKDEMFPMPAKFSQENPFGAQVATKDDLGGVGGGIPVVAFWSRSVGEAIGHVETLPLTFPFPCRPPTRAKLRRAYVFPQTQF